VRHVNTLKIQNLISFFIKFSNSVIATTEMKIKIVGNPERDVRKGETSQPPSGKIKKRKIEQSSSDDDENIYTIPSFQVSN
jgi:hypothetical protein